MSSDKSFVEKCLAGEAELDDIDDAVDAWHDARPDVTLASWLGMTEEEYRAWVEDAHVLRSILSMKKSGYIFRREDVQSLQIAARSAGDSERRSIEQWLRNTGRIS